MNLSNKQLSVLVDEIYLEILPKQKEQLNSFTDELKEQITKEIYGRYPNIINAISIIDGDNVKSIRLSCSFMTQILGKQSYDSEFSNIDRLIDLVYSSRLKQEFNKRFGEEITKDMIEKALILETIGASNIDDLIASVKKRLCK